MTICKDYLTKAFTNKIISLFGLPVFLTSGFFWMSDGNISVFAKSEIRKGQQPNVGAKSVYLIKTAVLGNNADHCC
jgi:succinate-acetate transporter protein